MVIIKGNEMGETACIKKMKNAQHFLASESQGKRPICKGEDYIRLVLRQIGYEDVGWIKLGFVNTIIYLPV
jgi:hypothetical protein